MPLTKALKSFRGRYGMIRAGSTFNCEPGYFAALAKKGFVEEAKEVAPQPAANQDPAPSANRDKGEAPVRAGKGEAGSTKPASNSKGSNAGRGTGRQPGAGKAVTSRSLRADLRSQEKTPPPSESGEKDGEKKADPSGV